MKGDAPIDQFALDDFREVGIEGFEDLVAAFDEGDANPDLGELFDDF